MKNTLSCKGFDFLGYRVVPGRRLRSSAESKRRFAEKFRRLYEQGASSMRLWRYAQRWWRWHRAGIDGRVALKGGLKRVVIRQLRMLGIVGFPIPKYSEVEQLLGVTPVPLTMYIYKANSLGPYRADAKVPCRCFIKE